MLLPIIQALVLTLLAALETLKSRLTDTQSQTADSVRFGLIVIGLVVTLVVIVVLASAPATSETGVLCGLFTVCATATP